MKMSLSRFGRFAINFPITVLLWFYFLFGYLFLLVLFFIPAYIFSESCAGALQNLNHVHLKIFFAWTRLLIPRTKFLIHKEVREIHSSVVVSNHISYLDPILFISIFQRQRTIVKNTFFHVPIFGWFLRNAGYVPSSPSEMMGPAMINNLESIKEHLAAGGNLFVFPEGTRSRDGKLAPFNKGVFSIARYCNVPLKLIYIKNTNKLFRPGYFSFNTRDHINIEVELLSAMEPDYKGVNFSISAVADEARRIYEARIAADGNKP